MYILEKHSKSVKSLDDLYWYLYYQENPDESVVKHYENITHDVNELLKEKDDIDEELHSAESIVDDMKSDIKDLVKKVKKMSDEEIIKELKRIIL